MNFYTLDGAKKKAADKNKVLCFWKPKGMVAETGHDWIYDAGASVRRWREEGIGEKQYSVRILVYPDGVIEGIV